MAEILSKPALELRDTWQARALLRTKGTAMGMVVLSVIAHNYDEGDALFTLLRATFPGFKSIAAPFLCSAARVAKTGQIVADMVTRAANIEKNTALFRDSQHLQDRFRRLADELKLSDDDRREMFGAVRNWVVADRRLDPYMNPADPEARRLVH